MDAPEVTHSWKLPTMPRPGVGLAAKLAILPTVVVVGGSDTTQLEHTGIFPAMCTTAPYSEVEVTDTSTLKKSASWEHPYPGGEPHRFSTIQ